MKNKRFYTLGWVLATALAAAPVRAWGPVGHNLIGRAGVEGAGETARVALRDLLGGDTQAAFEEAIGAACNWPDHLRETPEGEWSEPLHYVNMPRGVAHYDPQRDCPEGQCVTAAIVHYASDLGRPDLESRQRREAFSWLCHLVGDLHQPLHAGFAEDRGGNRVRVRFGGDSMDLHEFWDEALPRERLDSAHFDAAELLSPRIYFYRWQPDDVIAWTEEAHELAETVGYPPGVHSGAEIDDDFADRSWALTLTQWRKAAQRLASILDAVLTPAEAAPDDR